MSATWTAVGQIGIVVLVLAVAHRPLGDYVYRVLSAPKHLAVERVGYRVMRVDPDAEQRWSTYLLSVLGFSLASRAGPVRARAAAGPAAPRLGMRPLDPAGAWNTAVVVRDQHQLAVVLGRGGRRSPVPDGRPRGAELRLRGRRHRGRRRAGARLRAVRHRRTRSATSGRTWCAWLPADPAAPRVRRGRRAGRRRRDPEPRTATTRHARWPAARRPSLGGPVASQEAIKELGTNGGGFFNANSAHPFENPTPWTNVLEIVLLLLIPFALPRTFGTHGRRPPAGLRDPRRDGDPLGRRPSAS